MKSRFEAFDFYLLRVPRLPSKVAQKINGIKKQKNLWKHLVNLLDDPETLDAICLASEDFFEELMTNIRTSYTLPSEKTLETLYKYISRMSSRPTPYGKFSGVSVGELSEPATAIELSGRFICSYRLDMGFTEQLSKIVVQNPETQKQLVYYTNSTVYENADHFIYIDYNDTDNRRNYHWAKIVSNPLLAHVLNLAKDGKHFQELVTNLKTHGIHETKAVQYVCRLIEIKLLISELEPRVTATDSNDTISRLKTIHHDAPSFSFLASLDRCLQTLNSDDQYVQSFSLRKIARDVHISPKRNLFQADMLVDTTSNRISRQIIEELTRELEELSLINQAKIPNDLLSFRRSFLRRYGDREIPLLEAIDHQNGIGYGKNTYSGWRRQLFTSGIRDATEK